MAGYLIFHVRSTPFSHVIFIEEYFAVESILGSLLLGPKGSSFAPAVVVPQKTSSTHPTGCYLNCVPLF